MCSKSKKLRWADQECSGLNQNKNFPACVTKPFVNDTESACSLSSMRVSSTGSQGITSQLPCSELNSKQSSRADHNAVSSIKKQGYNGPLRIAVEKKQPSPGPLRVLASQTSTTPRHRPVRVMVHSPMSNGKQVLSTCYKSVNGEQRETTPYRPKFPSSNSTGPSRVWVKSAPSPGPRRILVTPNSKSHNQTPVRVPVQQSSISKRKRVLYADTVSKDSKE